MSITVALDNSVLGDVLDERIPEVKRVGREALDELLDLARQGSIELGIALSGTHMEESAAGERKRYALSEKLDGCGSFRTTHLSQTMAFLSDSWNR